MDIKSVEKTSTTPSTTYLVDDQKEELQTVTLGNLSISTLHGGHVGLYPSPSRGLPGGHVGLQPSPTRSLHGVTLGPQPSPSRGLPGLTLGPQPSPSRGLPGVTLAPQPSPSRGLPGGNLRAQPSPSRGLPGGHVGLQPSPTRSLHGVTLGPQASPSRGLPGLTLGLQASPSRGLPGLTLGLQPSPSQGVPGGHLGSNLASLQSVSDIPDEGQETDMVITKDDPFSHVATFSTNEEVPDIEVLVARLNVGGLLDERENALVTHKLWRFTPMYKRNARGALIAWSVFYNIATKRLEMFFGQVGGKLRKGGVAVVINKSGRNQHEQAVSEARQRQLLKYREDYYRPPGEETPIFKEAMFAKKYIYGQAKGNTRIRYPVMTQPKLDGARCLAHIDGNKMLYRSRGNKPWNHLNSQFDEEVGVFISYIPFTCELDGEAYIHGTPFSAFSSILKNMVKISPDIGKLIYNIYDFNCSAQLSMEARYEILNSSLAQYLADGYKQTRFVIVTSYLATSHEEIMRHHRHYMSHGYEGTMIRKLAGANPTATQLKESLYKKGRGMNLLKLKDVEDKEGTVVGVLNATGTEEGCAILVIRCTHLNASNQTVVTDVNMRPSYTFEERAIWFQRPALVMGKVVTYEFQNISEYGVPRNPVMKCLRDYE
jgi:hypothetical protein